MDMSFPDDWMFSSSVFILAITSAAFIQSMLGFGYGLIALAILPYTIGIRHAHLVVSLSALIPLARTQFAVRRTIRPAVMKPCLGGAAVGLPLGILSFVVFDPTWLVRATGLTIVLVVADGLRAASQAKPITELNEKWGIAAGAASGFLGGSVGISAPPIVAYAARQPWDSSQFRSVVVTCIFVIALTKVIGVSAIGLVDLKIFLFSLAAVPFAYFGAICGCRAEKWIPERPFRSLVMALLFVSAIAMVFHDPKPRSNYGYSTSGTN